LHFEQAGDADRAAEYLVMAGEHALERFANREAIGFFRRAGSLASDSQVDLRLRAAIGGAKAGWSFDEAAQTIDDLDRALVPAAGADRRLVAEAYFWIAFLRRQRGEVPESSPALKDALERTIEIGVQLNDPTTAALPKALMGSFVAFTGKMHKGAREMREALDVIEKTGDAVSIAMISNFLALTYSRLGEFAAAEETIARSHRVAGDGDAIAMVDADIAESALHLERGELDEASVQARASAERAEELGAYACVVASSVMFGAASLANDDANVAKAPLERGSELCHVTNMAPMRTLVHGLLGSARALLGDMPGGVAGWNQALAEARAISDRYGEAQTLWGRGRFYERSAKPDWTAALADLDRAVALFTEMDAKPSLARALHDRALALQGLGRDDEAAADERTSRKLGTELGLRDITNPDAQRN
jgi:tetratricopeptide (TPR) repeat protein